jgi:hypothetical protein
MIFTHISQKKIQNLHTFTSYLLQITFLKYVFVLIFLNSFLCNSSIAQNFRTEDYIYSDNIRTVQFYAQMGQEAVLNPPIVPLSQQSLRLDFDDFTYSPPQYLAKIFPCNADWTIAEQLNTIDYLQDFNEFYLTERESSFNTKVNYVHFGFNLPAIKLSGNYILLVYPNGYENKPIISRRFMVHENGVGIGTNQTFSVGGTGVFQNQQIDFQVNYSNYNIPMPMQQVQVVLRQNYRWDNALVNLKPTFVREFDKAMDFKYFQLENSFQGTNEYRIFDTRNPQARGWGIDSIKMLPKNNQYYLLRDASRNNGGYTNLMPDLNGRYYIQNFMGREASTEADYNEVIFKLKSLQLNGDVYVTGGFSDYRLSENYRMTYNHLYEQYELRIFLKQGVYNYMYTYLTTNKQRDDLYFEGTYQQTQNEYEVLVYYREIGGRTDRLIGYKKL